MSKKYQDMIGNILATFVDVVNEDKIYGFYHNSEHYYNTDYYTGNKHYFDELENLAIEKDEQESRKDKLIVGSKWECLVDNQGFAYPNTKNEVVVIKGIEEKFVIIECNDEDGEKMIDHNFILTQQFLLCFKPIKESE